MSDLTSEHTYLVAIDAWNAKNDVSTVKEFIRNSPDITDWWNYIPYVFLLVTPMSADELSEALKVHTKDAGLLVIEANPGNSQGLLDERAWKWINRRAEQSGTAESGLVGTGAIWPATTGQSALVSAEGSGLLGGVRRRRDETR
jgi:hypothetical protein